MKKLSYFVIGVFNLIVVLEASCLLDDHITKEKIKEVLEVHDKDQLHIPDKPGALGITELIIWAIAVVDCGYVDTEDPSMQYKCKKLFVCNHGAKKSAPHTSHVFADTYFKEHSKDMASYKTGHCGHEGLCKQQCKPQNHKQK